MIAIKLSKENCLRIPLQKYLESVTKTLLSLTPSVVNILTQINLKGDSILSTAN
jgi:hypothetical protein